jgi:putative peptidoglycan lipid II flippase
MFSRLPRLLAVNKWLDQQQNSILSAATIITVFNIISALSGIVRNRVFITAFYDTTVASRESLDALYVAFQIPDMLFQLIVFGAMSAAFVPVFISFRRESEEAAFKMTSILMTSLLGLFALFSLVILVFAEPITQLRTGSEFTPSQVEIVTNLTRIMLLGQFFLAISSFFGSILNSYQRFVVPALAPVLYNLGILAGVYLFGHEFGIYAAGLGVIIGAFIHMMVQLPLVLKLGFRYTPSLNWKFPGVKQVFKLTPPRILAISVSEIRDLLLGFFATSIGNSSMLIMQLALNIMTAPIRFFGVPISQAALPFMSEEVAKNDMHKLRDLLLQSLHQISFLILPASVLVLVLRVPIVRLLFGAANLPWQTTLVTARAVAIIALSIAAQGLVQLMIRAFYALKDTKTPLFVAIADIVCYLFLASITVFVFKWGVIGLAIATSTSALLELVLILYFLDKKLHCFTSKTFLVPQFKMLAASFFMAIFLYLPFRSLDEVVFDTTRTIELIALTMTTGTVGMLVYVYFAALFEIKELYYFTRLATGFGRWRKALARSPEVLTDSSVEGDTL